MWSSLATSRAECWCGFSENCLSLNPPTPSTRLSPYPFLPPPPLSSSPSLFHSFFRPIPPSPPSLFQPDPPQSPTHRMRRQGEEYDLTTLPEILPQQPPPPPTHMYAQTHSPTFTSIIPIPSTFPLPPLPSVPFPCSPRSPPRPPLPTTLLPGRNVFLSLSYTAFTQFPSPSTYSNIPHTLGPADPLRRRWEREGGQQRHHSGTGGVTILLKSCS